MPVAIAGGPVLPAARRVRVYPTREAWEAGRSEGGLGSSDIAAILGVSPYRGPWDVYTDRVLRQRQEVDPAKVKIFARGHREEPRILEDYAEETGARVLPVTQTTVDAAGLPLSVSPDAFVMVDGAWGLGEAKTDTSGAGWGQSGAVIERWTPAARDLVREDYAAQCYAQMLATGLPFASLIVRRSLDDLRHFVLLRDEALLARIAEHVAAWWDRHVLRREPPENDGSEACLAAKARLYSAGDRKDKACRDALPDEVAIVHELVGVQAEIKALEARERKLKAELADVIGTAYGIQWPGGRAVFADSKGRTTIDADALRAQHPDVYAAVSRTSEPSRSLRLYVKE